MTTQGHHKADRPRCDVCGTKGRTPDGVCAACALAQGGAAPRGPVDLEEAFFRAALSPEAFRRAFGPDPKDGTR